MDSSTNPVPETASTTDQEDDELTPEQQAAVEAYRGGDGVRDNAVLLVSPRGAVTIGDLDMRVTRIERAVLDVARYISETLATTVERHIYPESDR